MNEILVAVREDEISPTRKRGKPNMTEGVY